MNRTRILVGLRKAAPWLVAAVVATLVVFRTHLAPIVVQSHEIRAGPISAEVMGTGTLEARVKTTLSPRIQERLAAVLVDQGDLVKAGQVLARLDDGELRRQVEVAAAALASAQATAERVRVDEARAMAVEAQARLEHGRITDLFETRVASQSEMDKAIEQLRVAETDRQRARAATFEAAQQVVTAERNLDYHRERVGFAQILSPYDGLITRRDRDPGGVVVPGSSILQLIATNELWISAWIDETASAGLAVGQPAQVIFRSDPEREYRGEVARLGRETDRETREFVLDVRVYDLPSNWTTGQRAEVFIETGRRDQTLVLPQRFVQWQQGQSGVWVDDRGKARWREVQLGLHGRDTVEIVDGLAAGDIVVVPAGTKSGPLRTGQRLKHP
jgi:HlyD family secretion protein